MEVNVFLGLGGLSWRKDVRSWDEVGGLLVEGVGSELQASAEAREDIAGIRDGAHPGGSTQEPEEEVAGATLHPQVGMP